VNIPRGKLLNLSLSKAYKGIGDNPQNPSSKNPSPKLGTLYLVLEI